MTTEERRKQDEFFNDGYESFEHGADYEECPWDEGIDGESGWQQGWQQGWKQAEKDGRNDG